MSKKILSIVVIAMILFSTFTVLNLNSASAATTDPSKLKI
jgi:hypothetical protein